MRLLELQRTMIRAVMQPLTRSEGMRRKAPDGTSMHSYASRFVKPNNQLTSFERLEIYNRQYWFRLLSAMAEDFPGLRAVVGSRRFESMCTAYLKKYPSRSFTLRNLGRGLERWLRKNPRWAGVNQPLALDITRLEWADIEVFDGKAEPALRSENLQGYGPNFRLRLQPYIRLLQLKYPVDDLLLEVRKGESDIDSSSNAFQEKRKPKRVQVITKLKPGAIFLAVHRIDNSVYFRRLGREEFRMLAAIHEGKTLGRAIDVAFYESSMKVQERAAFVQQCFQNWATLGWFRSQ